MVVSFSDPGHVLGFEGTACAKPGGWEPEAAEPWDGHTRRTLNVRLRSSVRLKVNMMGPQWGL